MPQSFDFMIMTLLNAIQLTSILTTILDFIEIFTRYWRGATAPTGLQSDEK